MKIGNSKKTFAEIIDIEFKLIPNLSLPNIIWLMQDAIFIKPNQRNKGTTICNI